jgi:hypothetical protein
MVMAVRVCVLPRLSGSREHSRIFEGGRERERWDSSGCGEGSSGDNFCDYVGGYKSAEKKRKNHKHKALHRPVTAVRAIPNRAPFACFSNDILRPFDPVRSTVRPCPGSRLKQREVFPTRRISCSDGSSHSCSIHLAIQRTSIILHPVPTQNLIGLLPLACIIIANRYSFNIRLLERSGEVLLRY